jgi:hypothetical protein
MQQVARRNAIDVCKATVRIRLQIKACEQLKQTMMRAVRDLYRQRLLIEGLDIAIGEIAQQAVQTSLLGFVPA